METLTIHLAPIVRNMDNVIHWINLHLVYSTEHFVNIYPLDSVIQPLHNWTQELQSLATTLLSWIHVIEYQNGMITKWHLGTQSASFWSHVFHWNVLCEPVFLLFLFTLQLHCWRCTWIAYWPSVQILQLKCTIIF